MSSYDQGCNVKSGSQPNSQDQIYSPPARLLSLLLEIRLDIYRLWLKVNVPIIPYPMRYEVTYPRNSKNFTLSLNLLLVSKTIHSDTIPVLYGENKRIVPPALNSSHKIFTIYAPYFRSIILNLDYRMYPLSEYFEEPLDDSNDNGVERCRRRVEYIHTRGLESLLSTRDMIRKTFPSLHTVLLDLTYFNCPTGCCRIGIMEEWVCNTFRCEAPSVRYKVRGLFTEEEEELVCGAWGFGKVEELVGREERVEEVEDAGTLHVA